MLERGKEQGTPRIHKNKKKHLCQMTKLHEGLFRTEKILFPEDFLLTDEKGKEKRKQNEKEADEERGHKLEAEA